MRFPTWPRNEGSGNNAGAVLLATLLSISSLALTARADKTAADYFVHSLPGAPEGPLLKMHAGYVLSVVFSWDGIVN